MQLVMQQHLHLQEHLSNAGNNIFVYYLASQVGTVGHPADQNLSAGTGTFTGDVTIGDASAADKKILFDGNAQDYHIGLDDSADSLIIGKGSALGTTTSMAFNADGIITKPLQPAFLAMPNAAQDNVAEASDVVIVFGSERFDNNADFASNTFTAPVTGRYFLSYSLYVEAVDNAPTYFETYLVTSNKTYNHTIDPRGFDADPAYWTFNQAIVADMDAGDTAQIKINIHNGGTVQTDINNHSYFSGYLVA